MDEYESPDYYKKATAEQELQMQALKLEEKTLVEMLNKLQHRKFQLLKEGDRLNKVAAGKTIKEQGTSDGTRTTNVS